MSDAIRLEEYKARLGLPPEDRVLEAALRYHEARAKAQQGPVEEAITLYRRLLDLLPDEPWVYVDLVDLYLLRGATEEAVGLLLALGDVYLRLGRTDGVLRAYQQAAALAPHDPQIQARLAASPAASPEAPPLPRSPAPAPPPPVTAPGSPDGQVGPPSSGPMPTRPTQMKPAESTPSAPGPTQAGTEARPQAPVRRGTRVGGRRTETLGTVLQEMGLLTPEQLSQALEIQSRTGERLGQILLDMKVITEVQLAQAMGRQWGYRYVNLTEVKVDPDAVKLIPHSLALRLRVMPVTWERGRLVLAMIDPLNVIAVDDVRLMTGQEVEPVITTEDDLLAAINRHYQVETASEAVAQEALETA
ncbi:MAG: tetratricopeptide repeat protein, partial [Armatimonadota bacterium]|nr:tetratricopeptide repeat protein [Armatimonadota bacterium]